MESMLIRLCILKHKIMIFIHFVRSVFVSFEIRCSAFVCVCVSYFSYNVSYLFSISQQCVLIARCKSSTNYWRSEWKNLYIELESSKQALKQYGNCTKLYQQRLTPILSASIIQEHRGRKRLLKCSSPPKIFGRSPKNFGRNLIIF